VKSASPDCQDVVDKTVMTIKSRLLSVTEDKKSKSAELERMKSKWLV